MLSFDIIHREIEQSLKQLSFPYPPQSLYDPIIYTLELGGKRLRPGLVLMSTNLYKENVEEAMNTALGLEMFHNFTLLHDDLMDDADKRRNKPTVHKVWGDNTAILSGDAMMIASYQLIGKTEPKHLKTILDLFTKTALEICGGQQYDMEFETRHDVTEDEYMEMIRLKTAVLIGCAMQMGAIIGDASAEDAENLYKAGIEIGLAFQLQDDLLDVYGNTETFGKNIGGDIVCNKKTFLLINALRKASDAQRKELQQWIDKKDFNPSEKISAVTDIYNQLDLKTFAEKKIETLFDRGLWYIDQTELPEERTKTLKQFLGQLINREV